MGQHQNRFSFVVGYQNKSNSSFYSSCHCFMFFDKFLYVSGKLEGPPFSSLL